MQQARLATRLTFAVSVAAFVVFASVGAWLLREEETDLRGAAARDVRLLGRSLEVAFENALRDAQAQDVQETLRELERIDPAVDVFVYDASGVALASSSGAVERARWQAARPRETEIRFVPERSPRWVELLVPLVITRDERPATLVIARPLDDMNADLASTRWRVAAGVAGFVLVVAMLTNVLARIWVGVPLARMVARMARVRSGDLSPAGSHDRGDEVGETLRQFELLVDDLRVARERLSAEADMRRRLEEKLRDVDKLATIGQLAAGLAHEIGSPLQVLEGRLATLETKSSDAETRRIATTLLEQARRITRIVSRLTGVARRRHERTGPVELGPPMRTVVELLDGEARRRGVRLTFAMGRDIPLVETDPDSIQQVTLNLVRNALDATPDGGRIEVHLESGQLDRTDGRTTQSARIIVRDTGRGMDEATRERVFDAFYTTRAETGGTGLGLAVVKGIVDEHRGHVEVSSEPGRGSTFVIDLPAATDTRRADDGAGA